MRRQEAKKREKEVNRIFQKRQKIENRGIFQARVTKKKRTKKKKVTEFKGSFVGGFGHQMQLQSFSGPTSDDVPVRALQ